MKFNVMYALAGPAGTTITPNTDNPVEAEDLPAALRALADSLPNSPQLGMTIEGISIMPHPKSLADISIVAPVTQQDKPAQG